LVGHVTFQNVGHLPARKFYWLVKLNRGGSDWRPAKIKSKELEGDSVIPIGAEWPQGSKAGNSIGASGIDQRDHRCRCLLRVRNEWQRYSRTAKQHHEFAPLHSITSSAMAST
jgi:hypothetical protein